jgi:hypothetical protein
MITASELLELVDKDREARGMSHTGYAIFLGISKTYWTRLRTGQRRPTPTVIKAIKARIPELRQKCDDFTIGLTDPCGHKSTNQALRGQKNGITKGGDR